MRTGGKIKIALCGAIVLSGLLCGLAVAARAKGPVEHGASLPKHPNFNTFRILIDRNIFDATRKPLPGSSGTTADGALLTNAIRLAGTWLEGDRAEALFDRNAGGPPERVARGGAIEGYLVEEVRTDAVVLRNDHETLEVRVGAGLAKGKNGAWTLVADFPDKHPANATKGPAVAPSPPENAEQQSKKAKKQRMTLQENRENADERDEVDE